MLHESYASLITASNPVAFRPGMSATVELLTAHKNHVLTVPIQAVTLRIDSTEIAKGISKDVSNKKNSKNISAKTESKKAETCLFIMKDNKAKIVFVKTGIQDNEFIEITDGLQLSQEVITAPYSAISKMLFAGCPVKKVDKDKIFQVEQK